MPITFTCPCGQTLSADDERAGLPVRCPSCSQTPIVPHQLWDAPERSVPAPDAAPAAGAKPWLKGADPAPAQPGDPSSPFGFTGPADTARVRDRQVQLEERGRGKSVEGGILNSGAIGGLLAMIGAVVWFVAGLAFDTIFFYPPILFIIGLVAFFKGLMAGPEQHD